MNSSTTTPNWRPFTEEELSELKAGDIVFLRQASKPPLECVFLEIINDKELHVEGLVVPWRIRKEYIGCLTFNRNDVHELIDYDS